MALPTLPGEPVLRQAGQQVVARAEGTPEGPLAFLRAEDVDMSVGHEQSGDPEGHGNPPMIATVLRRGKVKGHGNLRDALHEAGRKWEIKPVAMIPPEIDQVDLRIHDTT